MRKWILGLVAAGMLGGIQTSHADILRRPFLRGPWQYDFHEDEIYGTPSHSAVMRYRDLVKKETYSISLACVLYPGKKPEYTLSFVLDSLVAVDKSQEFLILRFEDQIIERQVTSHGIFNQTIGFVDLNKQDWDMFIDLFSIENQWKPLVVSHFGMLDSYTVKLTWKDEKGEIARLKEACAG